MSNSVLAYMTPSLCLSTHIFIKNRMILEYKVTLFVLKMLSETYIVSAVFVIICSGRKAHFFVLENWVRQTRRNS